MEAGLPAVQPVATPATERAAGLTGGGARRLRETAIRTLFTLSAVIAVLILVGIFGVLFVQARDAFTGVEGVAQSTITPEQRTLFTDAEFAALPLTPPAPPSLFGDFLGSTIWNPTGNTALYGVGAMVVSTLLVTLSALALAAPLGIAVAAWLAYVARPRAREIIKPVIEVLAAIPSVVIGFIGIVVLGPWIARVAGVNSGLTAANGALLLAVMALPTIVSITEDALTAVPRDYVQASLALGADRWQTLVRVVLPAASSGVIAALMLGMGRAIGETMTVLMACGNATAMPGSLFDPVRTLTATIAIELGETEVGSRHFHALFAVGLVLFCLTFAVNVVSDVYIHRSSRGRA